ncbi:FAD-dependent oxidoreductase [Algoriphagus sp. oki45]|uniref:NAD(P)/FAD-dependent oxidoreductase n=1 Tax=Algoriphagus sp. oki45 TaxID=3067294 RepID=UPI0027F2B070|nr:FAD-dependent oxidoreductase [Algoriphagus sp. oki45]
MDLLLAMEIDFLIIGQGLAGSAMAYRLLQAGQKVMVIDQPKNNQSSRIAAGLYNPVTGKKMVKSWMAEHLFPEIVPFYQEIEKVLQKEFLHEFPIYRPFLNVEEQNEWMGHSSDPMIELFLERIPTSSQFPELRDSFGGVLLKQSGWLDIPVYLDGFADFLGQKLIVDWFKEEDLVKTKLGWVYRDIQAKALIYCGGVAEKNSRFFGFLPFAPVKGEILEVLQDFDPGWIVNRGVFRVPLGDGLFRVGSTYTWHDLDQGPTENAKTELLEKLHKLVKPAVIEVKNHRSGIRPATKDRKPFLGKHPEEDGVYIFNGFGAKGVSLIPYFSRMMRDFLLQNQPILSEVDIKRYFKYI